MKKLKALSIVFFLILIITGLARAEIYKWVDEDGVVHISDVPPEGVEPDEKVESRTPSESDPEVNPSPSQEEATLLQKLLDLFQKKPENRQIPQPDVAQANRPSPKVELYTTSWCPYCQSARDFFRSRGIPFTEYDIEKDANAAARKNQLDSRRGVPFAVINGRGIHGYAPAAYERALEGSIN